MKPFLTLHTPANARQFHQEGTWQDETLYRLLANHASATPDALALEDGRRQLTWQQVKSWVDGVASELRSYDLVGGDRVSIWMSNRVEAVVGGLAARPHGEEVRHRAPADPDDVLREQQVARVGVGHRVQLEVRHVDRPATER